MNRILFLVAIFTISPTVVNGQAKGSAEAARAIAEYKARLAAQERSWRESTKITVLPAIPEKPKDQSRCLSVNELKGDSVGYLEYWQFEVFQVVGPTDAIISLGSHMLWLSGYPTKGLVDREEVRIVGLVKVDGTKTYTTTGGSQSTLRIIRLVPAEEVKAFEEASQKAAKEAAQKAARIAEEKLFRTWVSADGKFTVEAKFVDYKDGKVTIQRRDGALLVVSTGQLSKSDRDYCREILQEMKSKKKNTKK